MAVARYNRQVTATIHPLKRPAGRKPAAEISSAIANRHLLAFSYDGRPRVVEPHTFGIIGDGRYALCGFQVGGGSRSGEHAGWKTFYVSRMREVLEQKTSFLRPRPEYRKGDRGFQTILSEL